ncbi:uncharacterized protein LOC144141373 [Haemaphysalis longicornis]
MYSSNSFTKRTARTYLLVLVFFNSTLASRGSRTLNLHESLHCIPPYEEDPEHFGEQNVTAALGMKGKVYVIQRNFNTTIPQRCLSSENVVEINRTTYILTLASTTTVNGSVLLKFNVTVDLLRTGNHTTENALRHPLLPGGPPLLYKLMYINPNNTCVVFIQNRTSSTETPECQLMIPADHADGPIPQDCQKVYDCECSGDSVKLYTPHCKNITTELSIEQFINTMTRSTTPSARP